jgi:hypothetical protein
MKDRAAEARPVPSCAFAVAAATGLAIVLGGMWLIPEPANATPGYASQPGLACGRCHVSPAGGGARTAFGNAFAANGHKVPSKGKKDGAAKPSKGGTTVTTVTPGLSRRRPAGTTRSPAIRATAPCRNSATPTR